MSKCCIYLLGVLLLFAPELRAQESLSTMLDRGYVAGWLVCGPFPSDLPLGIHDAVKSGRAPLGDKDFMQPIGGIARMRPTHQTQVDAGDGMALWQRAGIKTPSLDLSPFFPRASEGVAYAAFYAQNNFERDILVDLQSALGARVFVNGFPVREIRAAPWEAAGSDQFLVRFRTGLNLFVIEVPGAKLDSLARSLGLSEEALKSGMKSNRPLLEKSTGFEFALRLYPSSEVGDITVVPRLTSTGFFAGFSEDPRQEAALTLFNPKAFSSVAITVTADVEGARPIELTIRSIPPASTRKVVLPIPIEDKTVGEPISVTVAVESGEDRASFLARLVAKTPPRAGSVHLLNGIRSQTQTMAAQATLVKTHLEAFKRQMALLDQQPEYGFNLGDVPRWRPAFNLYPELRNAVKQSLLQGAVAAQASYGSLDERLVGGELLVRNLIYGGNLSTALLGGRNTAIVAWNAPAIAPQTPQILRESGAIGVLENLQYMGLPELFSQRALNGDSISHRRKAEAVRLSSASDLRKVASLQRKELLSRGFDTDILLGDSPEQPPEPFWLDEATVLAAGLPSLKSTGAAAQKFFEDARSYQGGATEPFPSRGRLLTTHRPGDILSQRDIKAAHALAENRTLTAEKFATLASLLGATYPDQSLDLAWRQLLNNATPDRLGFTTTKTNYFDTLAAYRETAAIASKVFDNAASYIAAQINTYDDAPSRGERDLALVVFNPSSWERTDLVTASLRLNQAPGLGLFDLNGLPVPFHADEVDVYNTRLRSVRVKFVAEDVPAMGYKTFYVRAEGNLPEASTDSQPRIENDALAITFDKNQGWAISSVRDKVTGHEYVAGAWNDFVAFKEDAANTDGGRELWTLGEQVAASRISGGDIEVERSPLMQTATIRIPFQAGTLVRKVTLYTAIPRIHFETRLEGSRTASHLLAVTFDLADKQLAPVFGERFGAVVGRPSAVSTAFQTRGRGKSDGLHIQPFLRWAALSAGDGLHLPNGEFVPFRPTTIVHAADPEIASAASGLQKALLARGIPTDLRPDVLPERGLVWTDSTDIESYDELDTLDDAFLIVLGGAQQNAYARQLSEDLPASQARELTDPRPTGSQLFLPGLPEGEGSVDQPTLIIAGVDERQTATLVRTFAERISDSGHYALAPVSETSPPGTQPRNYGAALLNNGAGLAMATDDSTLLYMLEHPDRTTAAAGIGTTASRTHQYWLHPFAGTWRTAGVTQEGHAVAEPLVAVTTDLHLAAYPSQQSMLSVEPAQFIVTALTPAASGRSTMSSFPVSAKEGFLVRGYESTGDRWAGDMKFFFAPYSASLSNPLGLPTTSLSVSEQGIRFKSSAFDIKTLWVQPSRRLRGGQIETIEASVERSGPHFTRYWRHNRGAAPSGSMPITLRLDGNLSGGDDKVGLTIANNLTDTEISGTVEMVTPDGWRISPDRIDYALSAGDFLQRELVLFRQRPLSDTGGVIAQTPFDGQLYKDLLLADDATIDLVLRARGNEIEAVVTNRAAVPAEGYVELIAPPEFWPENPDHGKTQIHPWRQAVRVAPFGEQRLVFFRYGEAMDLELAGKLAANGQVLYRSLRINGG